MRRLKWLDVANVIAMMCVVWFHIPSQPEMSPFMRNLEYVAVNIPFFILTGFSYSLSRTKDDSFPGFISKTLLSLGIPTLFFFFLFWTLWLVVGRQLSGDSEPWYQPLAELSCGSLSIVLATYWFIISLIMMRLIYRTLGLLVRNNHILLVICGLLPLLTCINGLPDVFELHRTLLFIPFFAIGIAFGRCYNDKEPYTDLLFPIVGLLSYVLLGYCLSDIRLYYEWFELLCGGVLMILILLLSIIKWPEKLNPLIDILRMGSLVLLATQNYIIGFSRVMLDRITHTPDFLLNHIGLKPLILILVYLLTIPIIIILRRFAPILLGRGK